MQVIHTNHLYKIEYPVGDDIHNWILISRLYAEYIQKLNSESLFVYLFCRGSSGAMLAALVSSQMDIKQILHIKKEGENSHSPSVPGLFPGKSFNVIVDDFISTGATIEAILATYPKIIFDLCVVAAGVLKFNTHNIKTLVTR